ncbi:hypothetical protein DET61_116102 [Marinobacter nauticus]|uniref:Uncharacterized protein n=1 Tax=Marinobacter nauticus TaxID=2743 RepID=A0A368X7S9_MARNT|nr:hypothetical protein DET61_116102 [Marinobacter nauticus]
MVHRALMLLVGFWIGAIPIAALGDTTAPDIQPRPEIPQRVLKLDTFEFLALDDTDLAPILSSAKLFDDSQGQEIPGVKAEWGTRCPEGFLPLDAETCQKVSIVPAELSCQDGFDLQATADEPFCERVETLPAMDVCPVGYRLDATGDTCSKTEIKPATPTCETGWSLSGTDCTRTLTQSASQACPDGYRLNGSLCEKRITQEPSQTCPIGSTEIDGMCSTVEYGPVEYDCGPGGTLRKFKYSYNSQTYAYECVYPVGVKEAGFEPREQITCKDGYKEISRGCYQQVQPTGCRWGTLTYTDDLNGWVCRYPAQKRTSSGIGGTWTISYCRDNAGQWTDGNIFYGDTCDRMHFTCPAGFSAGYGRCQADSPSEAGVETRTYVCDVYNGDGPLARSRYQDGKCWTTRNSVSPDCGTGEQNPDATIEINTYAGPHIQWDRDSDVACIRGSEAAKGTACPDGFDFDGSSAVCGSKSVEPAISSCPSGYANLNGVCTKSSSVAGDVSCPSGWFREGTRCVSRTVKAPVECPVGYTNTGETCVKKSSVSPTTSLVCPSGTIPRYCKGVESFGVGLFAANYGDENLSVAEQQAACESYTRDTGLVEFKQITSATQCSVPSGSFEGPGYRCGGQDGLTQYCGNFTAEAYQYTYSTADSVTINAFYGCPTGYRKIGNELAGDNVRCEKVDIIERCPDGFSYSGTGECVSVETLPINVACPEGYTATGDTCYQSEAFPAELSCPPGSELRGTECVTINFEASWTPGSGCPDGTTVVGGECFRYATTSQSATCPDGFVQSGSVCTRTDTQQPDYVCDNGSWNLQSTQCWKSVSTPSFYECPNGDWVLEGDNCTQSLSDNASIECPAGYERSKVRFDECIRTEEATGIQSNLLSVDLPKLWPGKYTLALSVMDATGNEGSAEFEINYQPQAIALRGGATELTVPAVQHAFTWKDGAATLVTEPIEVAGALLAGRKSVFVSVADNASTGYNIAGVTVEPGDYKKVIHDYDFDLANGVLELPLFPMSGDASVSDILISIGGAGEAASVLTVNAWTFSGEVKASKPSVMQIFEELQMSAATIEGTPCTLTGRDYTAESESELNDPYCYIEWDTVPAPLKKTGEPPRLEGKPDDEGPTEVGYSAYLIDRDGTRFKVGEASASVEVKKALGSFEFAFNRDMSEVLHTVEEVNVGLDQVAGPDCQLTNDEDRAIDYALNGYGGRLCYVEWFDLPGTLDQAPESSQPLLKGRVFSAGAYDLGLRVYAYSSTGFPVLIAEQRLGFEAIDPPKPSVEFVDGKKITDGLYEAYLDNGRIASALVQSKNADLEVVHKVNDAVVEERVFEATPWSREFRTYQRIEGTATDLWTRDTHTVTARYVDLPGVMASAAIDTITVPGEDIGPILYSDADYVLNDDLVDVSVRIGNIYQTDKPYDPLKMGEWEVRIVRQITYDTYEPLTAWADHDADGKVNLQIDLADIGIKEGFARLYAEARVKSPVPEYSRVEHSTRPVFLTILYGGEIDADIDGRRISGPVPFRGVFRLDLSDRGLFRAIGDVVWKLSTDGGETWVEKDNNARNMQYFDITLREPGSYMLKAELRNRNSGVAKETTPIEVIAYRKPEVSVEWLSDVFIGEEVTLDATVLMNGTEVTADDVDIEWSNDGGETFVAGGLQHVFERTTDPEEPRRERWAVRVKSPIAPEDDPLAWTIEDGSISFRGIRGPRLYIQGPRVVEVGKPYEFNIYKGLPYSRMQYDIEGYFTLPDGTEVPGDSVVYTPTDEDLETRYVNLTYTGWIKGWKEKGAVNTDDQALRVWEYKFPEFIIYGRYSANVAPVEAILYARPIGLSGRLEDPVYTWDLPEGVQVVEDTNPIARKVIIPEPGSYEFGVTVTDRRGNEGGVTEVVDIGTPEPYKLSMRIVGSNDYNRAPYEILARPDIDGGHPRDQVLEYNYSVDGVPMERVGRYGQAVLDEGEHTIRLDIVSEFGFTASTEETLTVYKNKPPVCELDVHEGTYRFTVRNVCHDPDGYVRDYDWWIDGEPLILSGYRISIPKQETGNQLVVESQATDDSGLTSEVVQSVITMPKPSPEPVPGEEEPPSEETP